MGGECGIGMVVDLEQSFQRLGALFILAQLHLIIVEVEQRHLRRDMQALVKGSRLAASLLTLCHVGRNVGCRQLHGMVGEAEGIDGRLFPHQLCHVGQGDVVHVDCLLHLLQSYQINGEVMRDGDGWP